MAEIHSQIHAQTAGYLVLGTITTKRMDEIIIYHNNECSKSNGCLLELHHKGIHPIVIDYLKNTPTFSELQSVIGKLGIKPFELIRTNEAIFTEKFAHKNFSDDEWIQVMIDHPILIQRPIVVKGDKAIIARPMGKLNDLL